MPGTTTKYALRYPVGSDAPNVATDMQNLANDVDSKVFGIPSGGSTSQWLKGPQGSAVWSGITPADVLPTGGSGLFLKGPVSGPSWAQPTQGDLPLNHQIGARTRSWDQNNLNNITESGWYNGSNMGNAPRTDWLFVLHFTHQNGGWATQVCWTMQTDPVICYTRYSNGSSWSAWKLLTSNPVCSVYRNASLAVAINTWTAVPFQGRYDSQDSNIANMWDGSTALYAPVTGVYRVAGNVRWCVDGNGTRYFAMGGSLGTRYMDVRTGSGGDRDGWVYQRMDHMHRFTAGQYAQMLVYHDSTSIPSVHPNDALSIRDSYDCSFEMQYISPY